MFRPNYKALASLHTVYLMSANKSKASFENLEEKAVSESASVSTHGKESEPIQRTLTARTVVDPPDGAPFESAISYQSVPAQPSIPDGGTVV